MSVLIPVLCFALALPALSASLTVRERLVRAVAGSRDLFAKSAELSDKDARMLAMAPMVREDRNTGTPQRYARAPEVAAYTTLRPWSAHNRSTLTSRGWPEAPVEKWPAAADAGALRKLLSDPDGEVRSLAVEALASLYLPEDVPRIAALLDDQAAGASVLGWSQQLSAVFYPLSREDSVVPERSWHERTVGTYAREALKIMTGHRFDGKDPDGVTFVDWWKTHNLGKSALWYWQQRLAREADAMPVVARRAGETEDAFWERRQVETKAHRSTLLKATAAELRKQPADVQWKVFLLTCDFVHGGNEEVTGPVNSFFPQGLPIALAPERLKELIAGTNLWPEMADVGGGRSLLLERLAMSMDRLTSGYGAPDLYKQALIKALESEDARSWKRPILVSRLKPPAPNGRLDDPEFREGYLRKALTDENEPVSRERLAAKWVISPYEVGYYRESVAAEMVRGNLKAQWPVLEKVFTSEKPFDGSDARIGILKALGEPPHTEEKTRRLAELIGDPRNAALFTQANLRMGMDQYRYYAVRSLNSIAGKPYISIAILQDLGTPDKSAKALEELRRLANELANDR